MASSGGREYREGYTTIRHRDLETRYLYRDAVASVRGVDVKIAPGLKVGYVMGVGDEVPAGLAQIGVNVQLLASRISPPRSHPVRRDHDRHARLRGPGRPEDLQPPAAGLRKDGGNLIVLYNTPGVRAERSMRRIPGTLSRAPRKSPRRTRRSRSSRPTHPVLNDAEPDHQADFDNWVEQRGSKFWDDVGRAPTRR